MKIGDLFKKPAPDPTLPPVPSRLPPCCHETAVEVMVAWRSAGRVWSTDELVDEVVRRRDAVRRRMQPVPEPVD